MKLSTSSDSGKLISFAGLPAGAWFGEGTVLKSEPRRYDLVALRETRLALMDAQTFFWLFENSVAFNRFLVRQLNERLGQFIGLVETDRLMDAPARIARALPSCSTRASPGGGVATRDHAGGDRPALCLSGRRRTRR